MSKGRIIVSTTTDNPNKHESARSHMALLQRQFCKYPNNTVRHALGMYEGTEELSVVIDIPDAPFIVLAASAHALCAQYNQKTVYFSHNCSAYLATVDGDMVTIGRELEGARLGEPDCNAYTRIIGTNHYIWTVNESI